jgi:PBSX family phage terminase large subunit
MNKYRFSTKQKDVINKTLNNKLGFINISEGSVRSGKTFSFNLAWIIYVLNSPHDKFLMSGESTDSLYRNVLGDMIYILGKDRATYQNTQKGGAQLIIRFDGKVKICYCRGGSKANDEGKIRGITVGGWYADEITLHHETFVKQALSRMSLNGAKAFWTTNPDNPQHFINTQYIKNAEKNGYRHWHFTLDDNLSLSQEYKENIKKAYSGLFYDRFIKGLWVMANGSIFDMWTSENEITKDKLPKNLKAEGMRYIAIDYGTTNPMVFLDIWDDGETIWVVNEYYFDSKVEMHQKTDTQYADDLIKFIGEEYPIAIILDPSAASFKAEMNNRGYIVKDADNEVMEGIRVTSSLMAQRKIKMVKDNCPRTLGDISSYVWDDKAKERGEEKPLKINDHGADALRYFCKTIIKPWRLSM